MGLLERFGLIQNGLRPNADAPVVGDVSPHNLSGGISDKDGRTGNVVLLHPALRVSHAETVNDGEVRVGKEGEAKAFFRRDASVLFNGVHADNHNFRIARLEFGVDRLQTLQFRNAKGSPEAAIEHHDQILSGEIGCRHSLTVLVGG